MMLSKMEARKKVGEDSGNGKLLKEIETISRALYLDKNLPRSSVSALGNRHKSTGKPQLPDTKSKIKYGSEDPSLKDKKSIWNWKPFKGLSNSRNRKFNCCFSLQVHSVEGLPSSFENRSVRVHWKRRDGELVTRPVKVLEGVADFKEKLMHTCAVLGTRSGPHHSAKYESKHFLLYASLFGAPEVDLGKHRVDLTRLLPITLEELEEDKSSGQWTTSYKLSGQAKGGTINVSFGYTVVGDGPELSGLNMNAYKTSKPVRRIDQGDGKVGTNHSESLLGTSNQRRHVSSQSVDDVKDLHEVLPTRHSEIANFVGVLHQKFDEDKLHASVDHKPELYDFTEDLEGIKSQSPSLSESNKKDIENECEDDEFPAVELGMESSNQEHKQPEDAAVEIVKSGFQVAPEEGIVLNGSNEDKVATHDGSLKENSECSKESVMKELDNALNSLSNLEMEALDSFDEKEDHMVVKTDSETNLVGMSLSLDDLSESVANDFLDMLGIEQSPFGLGSESEPESPRERLLRQFEKDALSGGYSLFDFDLDSGDQVEIPYSASTSSGFGDFSEDFEPSSVVQATGEPIEAQSMNSKIRAKTLEDLEAETLMREWGLNDKAFHCSPPKNSSGFGSPIDLPPEEPPELPALAEGLGPILQTSSGGFLRSMNPLLFKNAKNGGNLIMQVSSPVVVPAEMGSDVMEILQHLASVGIEKLSMQANKLMPLEDVTGKTMQQVAWETAGALEAPESQGLSQHELEIGQDIIGEKINVKERPSGPRYDEYSSNSIRNEMASEYVSLEDLAPLAMDKIEALSMEGLRIQSGVSDEDAPSNIKAQSIGEISALWGKGVDINGSLGLEGTAGLQLLDIKDNGDDIDGLMGLSLTLDEWMQLDSGEIGDGDEISERTSRILAAHHANSLDLIRGGSKGGRKHGKGSARKCGLLGNNFTVALMVQLRDPLRNFEPVGTPMLSLIQVERVFLPPKPKFYCTVSEVRTNSEEADESESEVKEEVKKEIEDKALEDKGIPRFRISEVHVAGLNMKTEPGKKQHWGNAMQQQSGSRWLLANGMGKGNKHQLIKSKADSTKSTAPLPAKAPTGDTLWSTSSRVHGTMDKWKEHKKEHKRNPNITFPKGSGWLR